jgi:hypothetical protein
MEIMLAKTVLANGAAFAQADLSGKPRQALVVARLADGVTGRHPRAILARGEIATAQSRVKTLGRKS